MIRLIPLRARHVLAAFLLLANAASVAHDGNPSNKLVAMESHGSWEVWCIDYGAAGDVRCNLNIVLVYKPRPDFRAMIPRVYHDGGGHRIEFAVERQTSLNRGGIDVDGREVFEFSACSFPCVVRGERAKQLLEALAAGSEASIRFHDHLIQAFNEPINLDGFATGLTRLIEMQTEHGD